MGLKARRIVSVQPRLLWHGWPEERQVRGIGKTHRLGFQARSLCDLGQVPCPLCLWASIASARIRDDRRLPPGLLESLTNSVKTGASLLQQVPACPLPLGPEVPQQLVGVSGEAAVSGVWTEGWKSPACCSLPRPRAGCTCPRSQSRGGGERHQGSLRTNHSLWPCGCRGTCKA